MRHNDCNAPSDDGNYRKNVNDVGDRVIEAVHRFRMNVKNVAAIKHDQRRDNCGNTTPKYGASRKAPARATSSFAFALAVVAAIP